MSDEKPNADSPSKDSGSPSSGSPSSGSPSSGSPPSEPTLARKEPSKAPGHDVGDFSAPDDAGPPASSARPDGTRRGKLAGVGRFVRAVIAPVRFMMRPFIFTVSENGNKVTFTSYSSLVYTWVLLPFGLLTWALSSLGWASPATLGWSQVGVIVLLLIMLGDDMGLWAVVITAMIGVLLAFAGHFLDQEYEVSVLSWLRNLLDALSVEYSPGLALALALFAFSIIAFYVLPKAWFVGRYEITTREVTHNKRGVAVDSWRRAGRDVKLRWPDLLETIAGVGAGGVYLLDRQQKPVMHIPNVICLWIYRHEIERVLEKIATTDYDDDDVVDDMD